MTPEAIAAIGGVVLALAFEYVPGLHPWFNKQPDNTQRLVMLAALVITVLGAFGLSCAAWLEVYPCTEVGVKDAFFALVAAIVANQGVHRLLPRK